MVGNTLPRLQRFPVLPAVGPVLQGLRVGPDAGAVVVGGFGAAAEVEAEPESEAESGSEADSEEEKAEGEAETKPKATKTKANGEHTLLCVSHMNMLRRIRIV